MNLKEFVAESLKEIIDGVKEAQDHAKNTNAEVCPSLTRFGEGKEAYYVSSNTAQKVVYVDFDVAVSAEEGTNKERGGRGGIKVAFMKVEAGLDIKKTEKESTISRLQFRLPVVWPVQ